MINSRSIDGDKVTIKICEKHLIPVTNGQAVNRGWPVSTGSRPHGVTWHWP